jgi:hypothetical protein
MRFRDNNIVSIHLHYDQLEVRLHGIAAHHPHRVDDRGRPLGARVAAHPHQRRRPAMFLIKQLC